MVVSTHRSGMMVDIIITSELGGDSIRNTGMVRWWSEEDLYRNTVQAVKLLFKDTYVFKGNMGGVNSHGLSIAVRAVLEDEGLADETDVLCQTRKLSPFIPTGEAALLLVLKYLRDADQYTVDHGQPVGRKAEKTGKPKILDPFGEKDYFASHQPHVRAMRREVAVHYLENLEADNWEQTMDQVKEAMVEYKGLSKRLRRARGFRM